VLRFEPIINLLRFFVERRQYSIVDRFANALSPEVIEMALYEAIRTAKSARDTGEKVELPDEDTIRAFINFVKSDISIAREVAIRSLSQPKVKEETKSET